MLKKIKLTSGQSIIEVIIALAIFVFIVGSGVVAILGAFTTTRLAEEETQATQFASQGIEAVKSIRNQGWNNLNNGIYGLSNSSGDWTFSGLSDDPDGQGKFVRAVTISNVERNGNNDIVSSGGTIDDQTKHVLVAVTWDFTPTRNNIVELETYLTNWQLSTSTSSAIPTPTPTPTPTGTPTPTPTATPTPTPFVECHNTCIALSYSGGLCRQNVVQCGNAGETNEPSGDAFCLGGANADTCCCAP